MAAKRILIYYPPNTRSIAIETFCLAIQEAGYELMVLTLTNRGAFHAELEKYGIQTFSSYMVRNNSLRYFLAQGKYLRRFCREHKIDIVLSHMQEGNIISVLAQPLLKPRLITFRHHAESAFYAEYGEMMGLKRNRKEAFLDRVINRLAKKIIVPSSGVWYGMEKYEGCNMKKVELVPYIYDFSTYPKPDMVKVNQLRDRYSCQLMLIMVSRMIPSKQHMPVFEVVHKLVRENLSIRMIVMDDGDLRPQLEAFIADNSLQEQIILTGFKPDFVNYMGAADLLMHPSVTEASNNVVKEMGLLEKAVAVCEHVGDFDDYIREGENGYVLKKKDLKQNIENVIRHAYENPGQLRSYGQQLRKVVLERFSNSKTNKDRLLAVLEKA